MQPTMLSGVRADFDVSATMRDGVVLQAYLARTMAARDDTLCS